MQVDRLSVHEDNRIALTSQCIDSFDQRTWQLRSQLPLESAQFEAAA
jgi:hypothetical protein